VKAAQAAVDAWRTEYNTLRPHQSLNMATPAERFRSVPLEQRGVLGLWLSPKLTPTGPGPDSIEPIDDEPDDETSTAAAAQSVPIPSAAESPAPNAVEIDRIVTASGNLGVCGRQFWLGPQRAGHKGRAGGGPAGPGTLST
jgi:hypothetical protein